MLKNSNKYENRSHFSYNDYKKKVNKKTNKDMNIFVSVFFIGLLILLGLAKVFSPNVDIGIASNNDIVSMEEEETTAASIDERLKTLKLEDEGKRVEDETMFSPELDEKVILPHQNRPTVGQMEAENNIINEQKNEQEKEQLEEEKLHTTAQTQVPQAEKEQPQVTEKPKLPVVEKPAEPEKTINARVVVGSYATEKQAEVAKSIIQEAGLGITPVVKNIGGYYTLQVGSFNSKEKAQQMMNNLLKSNFPARVIVTY